MTAASPLASFISRAQAFARDAGISETTLGLYLFKDGKAFERINQGGDVGSRTLERAEAELARRTRELKQRRKAGEDPRPAKKATRR